MTTEAQLFQMLKEKDESWVQNLKKNIQFLLGIWVKQGLKGKKYSHRNIHQSLTSLHPSDEVEEQLELEGHVS